MKTTLPKARESVNYYLPFHITFSLLPSLPWNRFFATPAALCHSIGMQNTQHSSDSVQVAEHNRPAHLARTRKDPALAAALCFFFGPLGLIYTRPLWAIGMSLLSVPVAVLTASIGLLLIWPACMLLGY